MCDALVHVCVYHIIDKLVSSVRAGPWKTMMIKWKLYVLFQTQEYYIYFSFVLFLVLDLTDITHRHIMVQVLAKCLILDQQFDQMFHWNIYEKDVQICGNVIHVSVTWCREIWNQHWNQFSCYILVTIENDVPEKWNISVAEA